MTQTRHLSSTRRDTPISAEPAVAVDEAPGGGRVSRRALLKAGAGGAAALGFYSALSAAPDLSRQGLLSKDGVFGATSQAFADSIYTEVVPTTPLVLNPFKADELPIPKVLQPTTDFSTVPGGKPTKDGPQTNLPFADGKTFQKHQLWPTDIDSTKGGPLPEPDLYYMPLEVSTHDFTSSPVLPIDSKGQAAKAFDSKGNALPAVDPKVGTKLPPSLIYGFRGSFPGPAIHARYGQPAVVRFHNQLGSGAPGEGSNTTGLSRGDFGSPDQTFLTHLHNGHTAPESDGNPHYFFRAFKGSTDPRTGKDVTGYPPGKYVDNLYLNWPAAGDPNEKQSFFCGSPEIVEDFLCRFSGEGGGLVVDR